MNVAGFGINRQVRGRRVCPICPIEFAGSLSLYPLCFSDEYSPMWSKIVHNEKVIPPKRQKPAAPVCRVVHLVIGIYACIFGMSILFFALAQADAAMPQPLVVRVGIYDDKPMAYIDDTGNPAGLFPDVLDSIAVKEGWQLDYVFGAYSQCLERLEKNEIDLMVDAVESDQRVRRFLFNQEAVFVNWQGVYLTGNTTIRSLSDLRGGKIAFMEGGAQRSGGVGIQDLMAGLHIPCTFVRVGSYGEVFALLSRKEVTAGVVSRIFGTLFAEKYDVKRTSIVFDKKELKFAFNKNSPLTSLLMADIDRELPLQKEDLNSIYNRAIFVYLSGLPRERIFSDSQ